MHPVGHAVRESHCDLVEAGALQTLLVLPLRERARNAADIASALGSFLPGKAVLSDDVCNADAAAGPQDPVDLARGFVRCEVIRWSDLVESGSRVEVARRGLQRVEGKTYVVQDGDVLNVRSGV